MFQICLLNFSFIFRFIARWPNYSVDRFTGAAQHLVYRDRARLKRLEAQVAQQEDRITKMESILSEQNVLQKGSLFSGSSKCSTPSQRSLLSQDDSGGNRESEMIAAGSSVKMETVGGTGEEGADEVMDVVEGCLKTVGDVGENLNYRINPRVKPPHMFCSDCNRSYLYRNYKTHRKRVHDEVEETITWGKRCEKIPLDSPPEKREQNPLK